MPRRLTRKEERLLRALDHAPVSVYAEAVPEMYPELVAEVPALFLSLKRKGLIEYRFRKWRRVKF